MGGNDECKEDWIISSWNVEDNSPRYTAMFAPGVIKYKKLVEVLHVHCYKIIITLCSACRASYLIISLICKMTISVLTPDVSSETFSVDCVNFLGRFTPV